MGVFKAPVRQQSYLTEYDKQMAEYLRQMGGGIGPQDIASEAYGGKFPVGTMTAKILSGVLAGVADKRAANREERTKESYSRAREIANAMDNPQLSRDGSTMSINPETGNFQYIPTYIPKGEQTTSTWGFEDYENEAQKRINAMGNFENLSEADKEKAREVWRTQEPLPEVYTASPYSPTGIPYALKDLPPKDITEDMRYTVGEKAPEDSTQLGRFLRGTLPQDVLPINAEKALSQALRGANVSEFEFDEYRQNRMVGKQPKYSTPFMLYGTDGSKNTVMTRQNSNGTMEYVDINQNKFNQKPNVTYSLDASKIDTTKPYKISFTNGSEPVTKSGYIRDGKTYIQWNGKETLVTDIPNVENVEPTSLAKGNTFNIGAKDNKFQEVRASKTADKWTDWDTAAYQAEGDINLIDTAMTLIAQETTPSGMSADLVVGFKRALKTLNPNLDIPEAANAEALVALLNEGILGDVKRLTGPISEKELKFLSQIQANLGGTKEGNAAILLYKKMLARKQSNWNSYVESKGGEPGTYQEANKMFREYSKQFNEKHGEGAEGFLNFAKAEAEIEVGALKQQLDDKKITTDEYKKRAFYIVNNKYQLPYLQKQYSPGF